MRRRFGILACVVGGMLMPTFACGAESALQRITAAQYRNTVAAVFGTDIVPDGALEPDVRSDGLAQVGAAQASVTAAGFEQYDAMAHAIAARVVSPQHRDRLIPCKPANAAGPDEACAARFITAAGRFLFRRALTTREQALWTAVASAAARDRGSFYEGLAFSLAGMLESPHMLFRRDVTVRGRLDGYSKAARLSFLMWNAGPDAALMDAAEKGRLDTRDGWRTEVARLMASPRHADGLRAFFGDMLGLAELDTVAKDTLIYPFFTRALVVDAKEQTLRTIMDVVGRDGDYRDIFTTPRTHLTAALAAIYDVDGVTAQGWTAHDYAAGDPRAGILGQVGFAALHSHEGRTSPTLRGKAVREVILCQEVPDPPGNVSFALVQDLENPKYRTARDRMTAHITNPVCAGCHKLIDPLGFPLEVFDSDGRARTTENGAVIDTSGTLGAVAFESTAQFSKAVANDPAAGACLVNRLYSYALSRTAGPADKDTLARLQADFTRDGHRVSGVLRGIALSPQFFAP